MQWSWRALIAAFGALCLAAQPGEQTSAPLAPEVALLARIRQHMRQNLNRLPNYTCLQTIQRSQRRLPAKRYELIDMLRLEVALVDGKELFAWPGEDQFQDREISQMVSGGAIGTGIFALFARTVFLSDSPRFTPHPHEVVDGRELIRFDFKVPRLVSGYTLRVGTVEGIAGYHGTFWSDPQTLDLVKLDVAADDIPPQVPLTAATSSVRYDRMRIGESNFLLPSGAEMGLTDLRGNESVNRTRFSACRQYQGESQLRFDDVTSGDGSPKPIQTVELPPGLILYSHLQEPLREGEVAIGDPVTFVVEKDVRYRKNVLVPKGALLLGRVTTLHKVRSPVDSTWIGFDLHHMRAPDLRAELHVQLDEVPNLPVVYYPFRRSPFYGTNSGSRLSAMVPPARDTFLYKGKLDIPANFRLTWFTVSKDKP